MGTSEYLLNLELKVIKRDDLIELYGRESATTGGDLWINSLLWMERCWLEPRGQTALPSGGDTDPS